MQTEFITQNFRETKKLGKLLADELFGGEVICLYGELGAGKTTFSQGLLEGLGAQKPYTSPTFVVMKKYEVRSKKQEARSKKQEARSKKGEIKTIYHLDAYRVETEDILNLGWEEIITNPSNICIVEWAERIEKIIPERAVWIGFEWQDVKRRKLTIGKKGQLLAKNQKAC